METDETRDGRSIIIRTFLCSISMPNQFARSPPTAAYLKVRQIRAASLSRSSVKLHQASRDDGITGIVGGTRAPRATDVSLTLTDSRQKDDTADSAYLNYETSRGLRPLAVARALSGSSGQ